MKIFSSIIPFLLLALIFGVSTVNPENNTAGRIQKIISCGPGLKKIFAPDSLDEISINDNRNPAGELKNGVLTLNLEARTGIWYPETHEGSGLRVYAFAEKNKPMQLPGPVIHVPEGTEINATITNKIKEHALVLYGFYSRPGNEHDSIVIPTNKTVEIKFNAGKAGTYFYRAAASDSLTDDGLPWFNDSQLYGAFIVGPVNQQPDPAERIIMIGVWNDTATNGGEELVLNGRSWPFTENLNYQQGEDVHWRLINASNQVHPMHLHGFFYTVNSKGHINKDFLYQKEMRRKSVTELMHPGETMSMTWNPEREGNWLFHCHTLVHIMPGSFLRATPEMNGQEMNDVNTHAREGMGGLIMAIHVDPDPKIKKVEKKISFERQLTMVIGEEKNYLDTLSGKGFIILKKNSNVSGKYNIPGPPIILTQNEPVAIKIINHLNEPTTMHWHGLEIESYYDGVAGFGNRGNQLAPLIQPGDSFTVHITPPRAGTYIYHTHMHNFQLLDGMCGPLIVLKPGEKYNPATDKTFFISQADQNVERYLFLLNGTNKTDTMQIKPGLNYRFRITNITALGPQLNVSLLLKDKPVQWKWIAKDGADFPPQQCESTKALDQTISIGQTMDFAFHPSEMGYYSFELRSSKGKLFVKKVIHVK